MLQQDNFSSLQGQGVEWSYLGSGTLTVGRSPPRWRPAQSCSLIQAVSGFVTYFEEPKENTLCTVYRESYVVHIHRYERHRNLVFGQVQWSHQSTGARLSCFWTVCSVQTHLFNDSVGVAKIKLRQYCCFQISLHLLWRQPTNTKPVSGRPIVAAV